MRNLWYELCETRFRDSPTLKRAEAVEDIKNHQHEQGALLNDIKGLLGAFYSDQSQNVMAASTTSQLGRICHLDQRRKCPCPPLRSSFWAILVRSDIARARFVPVESDCYGFATGVQRSTVVRAPSTVAF
jgi:hypothetical protein